MKRHKMLMDKKGFTLAELLIASSLVLLVVAADVSVRAMSHWNLLKTDGRAIAQNEAALAMASIAKDINAARYVEVNPLSLDPDNYNAIHLRQDEQGSPTSYPDPLKIPDDSGDAVVEYRWKKTSPYDYTIQVRRYRYGGVLNPWQNMGAGKIKWLSFGYFPGALPNSNVLSIDITANSSPPGDASEDIRISSAAALGARGGEVQ